VAAKITMENQVPTHLGMGFDAMTTTTTTTNNTPSGESQQPQGENEVPRSPEPGSGTTHVFKQSQNLRIKTKTSNKMEF